MAVPSAGPSIDNIHPSGTLSLPPAGSFTLNSMKLLEQLFPQEQHGLGKKILFGSLRLSFSVLLLRPIGYAGVLYNTVLLAIKILIVLGLQIVMIFNLPIHIESTWTAALLTEAQQHITYGIFDIAIHKFKLVYWFFSSCQTLFPKQLQEVVQTYILSPIDRKIEQFTHEQQRISQEADRARSSQIQAEERLLASTIPPSQESASRESDRQDPPPGYLVPGSSEARTAADARPRLVPDPGQDHR